MTPPSLPRVALLSRPAVPSPPSHLKRGGRELWRRVNSEYELTSHFLVLLRLACEALDRCDQARAAVDSAGLIVAGSEGQPRPHPLLAVERDGRLATARLLREIGLSEEPEADPRPPRISNRYA
jgi:P27 family predicted phage terminase small subunit